MARKWKNEADTVSNIKSPLPTPGTLPYLLLELTALSGEFPTEQMNRLSGSESYKANILARLKSDRLLRSYSHDCLRGLRLTAAAKRALSEAYPDRFAELLSGETILNEPKYDIPSRLRLHRMAEVFVTMLRSGFDVWPWEKPGIFLPDEKFESAFITRPAYYTSAEVKGIGVQANKIRSSRATGILFTPETILAVYNTADGEMKWEYRTEIRLKVLLEMDICHRRLPDQYSGITPDAIIFGSGMEQMLPLMEAKTSGHKYYVLDGDFPHFYYLTGDHYGEVLLRLLFMPERKMQLDKILMQDLKPGRYSLTENDGFDADGNPVLFGYTCDMPRIHRFHTALSLHEKSGTIICFDFQERVLRRICGERVSFVCIDFDQYERSVFNIPP